MYRLYNNAEKTPTIRHHPVIKHLVTAGRDLLPFNRKKCVVAAAAALPASWLSILHMLGKFQNRGQI